MDFGNIFGSRKRIKLLVATTNKNIEEINVELHICAILNFPLRGSKLL